MRRVFVLFKNLIGIPVRLFNKVSIFAIIQNSKISKESAVSSGVKFYRSSLNKYSYIGRKSFIIDTEIGKFCSIAPGCNIGGTSHPIEWVSSSSVFHKWDNILKKNFSRHEYEIFKRTKIENDVWIATNVIIKAGVIIENGAVIGAGSVITKNIGPYEVWAGNPARLIKKRFSDEKIIELEKLKWWDLPEKEIKKLASNFNDVDKVLAIAKERSEK